MEVFSFRKFLQFNSAIKKNQYKNPQLRFNGYVYSMDLQPGTKIANADRFNSLWRCKKKKLINSKNKFCSGRAKTIGSKTDGYWVTESAPHYDWCKPTKVIQ